MEQKTNRNLARPFAFAMGCIALMIGVFLHLPMFAHDLMMGQHLMGMPFDAEMKWGMALILGGTVLAGAALWRNGLVGEPHVRVVQPSRLSAPHWILIAILVLTLVIDTMKPATLGFVVPGMAREYGLPRSEVAWLPFAALTGTTVGSVLWGWFADHQGRRAAILLSTLMFIGTAICGAMPSFEWNIVMCFLMGASAGGLLPVAYALLAELLPLKRRGLFLVAVGGLGAAGGFFMASGMAAALEPVYGWRVLWLIGLPTGIVVLLASLKLPKSPVWLVGAGRIEDARKSVTRYGGRLILGEDDDHEGERIAAGFGRRSIAILTIVGLIWGLTNFGFLLWLPTMLKDSGVDVSASSTLLAQASFVAFLVIIPATILYDRMGGANALILSLVISASGLVLIGILGVSTLGIFLLLIGVNAVIAMLLPYAAECSPPARRGRAIGVVAAGSKAGGIGAQAITLAGYAPDAGAAAWGIAVPLALVLTVMIAQRIAIVRERAVNTLLH